MFGGIDPKKMQAMMKQMGIAQEEIDASKVIIEKTDNTRLIIENPSVIKIKMQGQESFQITGEAKEETSATEISEEDIETIIEKNRMHKKTSARCFGKNRGFGRGDFGIELRCKQKILYFYRV